MPTISPMLRRPGRVMLAVAAVVGASIGLSACGGSDAAVPPPIPKATLLAQLSKPVPGLTPAEKALDRAAGTVLAGDGGKGLATFEAQLAGLKGTPVVANLWGEWCSPCKKEIPLFQRAAIAHHGQVAFLGVATNSTRSKTESYLANERWLPYPSVLDNDGKVSDTTHVTDIPVTLFFTPAGKRFVHIGPYETVAALNTDIARYTK